MFNDLNDSSVDKCFEFVLTCANAVLPSFIPIIESHLGDAYNDQHVRWQQLRRGR